MSEIRSRLITVCGGGGELFLISRYLILVIAPKPTSASIQFTLCQSVFFWESWESKFVGHLENPEILWVFLAFRAKLNSKQHYTQLNLLNTSTWPTEKKHSALCGSNGTLGATEFSQNVYWFREWRRSILILDRLNFISDLCVYDIRSRAGVRGTRNILAPANATASGAFSFRLSAGVSITNAGWKHTFGKSRFWTFQSRF